MKAQIVYELICLNPGCKRFGPKFFPCEEIIHHKDCEGWVLQIEEMKRLLFSLGECNSQASKINVFDFKQDPIRSLFSISSVFGQSSTQPSVINLDHWPPVEQKDPIQLMRFTFNQLRTKIQNELERTYLQVEARLLKVKEIQEKTVNEVKRILTTIRDEFKVAEEIQKSQILNEYKDFCAIADSFTLIEQQKVNKELFQLFESVHNIGNSFWNTELDSIKREKQLFEKARAQLQQFHNDETIHPALKLTNLQNIFQMKNVQPQCSEDKMSFWMKCWICEKEIFDKGGKNIKERKASTCRNLITHVTQQHRQQTTTRFTLQTIKSSTHRLTYPQFITLLQSKPYTEFIIVDRQNISKGILSTITQKLNQNILILDVVSMQNENLAVGKYLVAMSQGKDAADILMVMAIYAIITSGYYRWVGSRKEVNRPRIVLVTKDHFGETLQHILKNDFDVDIEVVK